MKSPLLNKIKESFFSCLPIIIFVCLLGIFLTPLSLWTILQFLFCAILIIVGMSFFSLGADLAMMPIGDKIGSSIAKTGKLWLILVFAFILGTMITFAEPDLLVLANQVSSVNPTVFIATVSIGVGFMLLVSTLRNRYKISLSLILAISYGIVFLVAIFVPQSFIALSFDSGSVTTGVMSVPFILAFGMGIASIKGSAESEDESFGMIALSSVGPIIAVMLIGIISSPEPITHIDYSTIQATSFVDLIVKYINFLPSYLLEVAIVLLPIIVIFLLFQFVKLRLDWKSLWKIFMGLLYAYMGIALFLSAVNFGFLPVGNALGGLIANLEYNWLAIPLMFVLGYVIVLAEPAVMVLTKQVEMATNGAIKGKVVLVAMCLGVAIALGLVALRVFLHINLLYFIIPIYAVCVILAFIVSPMFTGIAFDSGGVATGAMASTFVLPLVIGFVQQLNYDIMLEGFGTLALIAAIPILAILLLGTFYKLILKRTAHPVAKRKRKVEIIEFDR